MSFNHHKEKWQSITHCHLCKKQTLKSDAVIVPEQRMYFGVEGYSYIEICKECHRERLLNKIL